MTLQAEFGEEVSAGGGSGARISEDGSLGLGSRSGVDYIIRQPARRLCAAPTGGVPLLG